MGLYGGLLPVCLPGLVAIRRVCRWSGSSCEKSSMSSCRDSAGGASVGAVASRRRCLRMRRIALGQVMKATGGKANPKAVNDIVRGKLGIG